MLIEITHPLVAGTGRIDETALPEFAAKGWRRVGEEPPTDAAPPRKSKKPARRTPGTTQKEE